MTILGIDTSTATASGALIEDGKLIKEEVRGGIKSQDLVRSVSNQRINHAEILLPLVETLLKEANRSWHQISALALSIGPGSFTGLRIGLSTVKGLAYGWDIPVIGVPTLLAVASRVTGWNGLICPILDARKKEVYTALFRVNEAEGLIRLTEDLVCLPEQILARSLSLGQRDCLFIGDGTRVYGELIQTRWGGKALITQGESYRSTAFAVAYVAAQRVKKRDFDSLDLLAPLYLRPSEAELKKRPG